MEGMSDNSTPDFFSHTKKAYWGGPWYPYWTLIVISIVGGLFGLDHLWLRSTHTAMLKPIVNILTFGLWYFYDLIQILGEKETVMKHGLSIPLFGAAGIGSGMFVDNQPDATQSKSPFRFLAYCFLAFLPFGFDMVVAGDTYGGIAKFLSSVLFLLWPISILWTLYTIGQTWLFPRTVMEEGTTRIFPWSFIMNKHGYSMLGPVDVPRVSDGDKCGQTGEGGLSGIVTMGVQSAVNVASPLVQTAISSVLPGVIPAVTATSAAVQAGATTAKLAADSTSSVINKTGNLVTSVLDAVKNPATQLASAIPASLNAIPTIVNSVEKNAEKFTNVESLKKLANTQTGGGSLFEDTSMSSISLFLFFVSILGIGSYYGAMRLNIKPTFFSKEKKSNGLERNDNPPKPHAI